MRILIILVIFFIVQIVYGHEIHYTIENKNTVVLSVFDDDKAFSFENYEIYSPESDKMPYQIGKTSKAGKIAFLPEMEGTWIIKVFSDDGHGFDKKINIDKNMLVKENKKEPSSHMYLKIIAGIGFIFGVFGLINIFSKRKKKDTG